jgi:hypothetical protein
LPFLRFTRDKRGYENTYLMHTFRRRGKSRSRILYWYRTPPNVRIGRAALDEEAIRAIENHHPDVAFDWDKILEAQPPAEAPVGRERREVPRGAQPRSGATAVTLPEAAAPAREPAAELPATIVSALEDQSRDEEMISAADAMEEEAAAEPELEPPDEDRTPAPRPVEQLCAPEQLAILRARYAELMARLADRHDDPTRLEEWRRQIERLNPDEWVTLEEVREGIDRFNREFVPLHQALGPRRRRRRSRRGGARRRRKPQPTGTAVAAAAATPDSETSGAPALQPRTDPAPQNSNTH